MSVAPQSIKVGMDVGKYLGIVKGKHIIINQENLRSRSVVHISNFQPLGGLKLPVFWDYRLVIHRR